MLSHWTCARVRHNRATGLHAHILDMCTCQVHNRATGLHAHTLDMCKCQTQQSHRPACSHTGHVHVSDTTGPQDCMLTSWACARVRHNRATGLHAHILDMCTCQTQQGHRPACSHPGHVHVSDTTGPQVCMLIHGTCARVRHNRATGLHAHTLHMCTCQTQQGHRPVEDVLILFY